LQYGTVANVESVSLTQVDDRFQLFPNPTSLNATVALTIQEASSVELSITDMSGKVMNQRDYGQISGSYTIDLPTADFPAGIYLVELTINGEKQVKRLVKE
jgi:hypothetical protein